MKDKDVLESEFIKKFEIIRNMQKEKKAILRGKAVLVEFVEEPPLTTAGGIVLASDKNQRLNSIESNKAHIGVVLALGDGYYDPETDTTEPLDVPIGAVVLIPQYSATSFSTFPGLPGMTRDKIGMVPEDQILFYYPTVSDYLKARNDMNKED